MRKRRQLRPAWGHMKLETHGIFPLSGYLFEIVGKQLDYDIRAPMWRKASSIELEYLKETTEMIIRGQY